MNAAASTSRKGGGRRCGTGGLRSPSDLPAARRRQACRARHSCGGSQPWAHVSACRRARSVAIRGSTSARIAPASSSTFASAAASGQPSSSDRPPATRAAPAPPRPRRRREEQVPVRSRRASLVRGGDPGGGARCDRRRIGQGGTRARPDVGARGADASEGSVAPAQPRVRAPGRVVLRPCAGCKTRRRRSRFATSR